MKKYVLNKAELERLGSLLSIAKFQEEIFGAITDRYKAFLMGSVFKRLKLDAKLIRHSSVDLRAGELIIDNKDEKPKTKKA